MAETHGTMSTISTSTPSRSIPYLPFEILDMIADELLNSPWSDSRLTASRNRSNIDRTIVGLLTINRYLYYYKYPRAIAKICQRGDHWWDDDLKETHPVLHAVRHDRPDIVERIYRWTQKYPEYSRTSRDDFLGPFYEYHAWHLAAQHSPDCLKFLVKLWRNDRINDELPYKVSATECVRALVRSPSDKAAETLELMAEYGILDDRVARLTTYLFQAQTAAMIRVMGRLGWNIHEVSHVETFTGARSHDGRHEWVTRTGLNLLQNWCPPRKGSYRYLDRDCHAWYKKYGALYMHMHNPKRAHGERDALIRQSIPILRMLVNEFIMSVNDLEPDYPELLRRQFKHPDFQFEHPYQEFLTHNGAEYIKHNSFKDYVLRLTPLGMACESLDIELIRELLALGADVNPKRLPYKAPHDYPGPLECLVTLPLRGEVASFGWFSAYHSFAARIQRHVFQGEDQFNECKCKKTWETDWQFPPHPGMLPEERGKWIKDMGMLGDSMLECAKVLLQHRGYASARAVDQSGQSAFRLLLLNLWQRLLTPAIFCLRDDVASLSRSRGEVLQEVRDYLEGGDSPQYPGVWSSFGELLVMLDQARGLKTEGLPWLRKRSGMDVLFEELADYPLPEVDCYREVENDDTGDSTIENDDW